MTPVYYQVALATYHRIGRLKKPGRPKFVHKVTVDEDGKMKVRYGIRELAQTYGKFNAHDEAERLIRRGYCAVPVRDDVKIDEINYLFKDHLEQVHQKILREYEAKDALMAAAPKSRQKDFEPALAEIEKYARRVVKALHATIAVVPPKKRRATAKKKGKK